MARTQSSYVDFFSWTSTRDRARAFRRQDGRAAALAVFAAAPSAYASSDEGLAPMLWDRKALALDLRPHLPCLVGFVGGRAIEGLHKFEQAVDRCLSRLRGRRMAFGVAKQCDSPLA